MDIQKPHRLHLFSSTVYAAYECYSSFRIQGSSKRTSTTALQHRTHYHLASLLSTLHSYITITLKCMSINTFHKCIATELFILTNPQTFPTRSCYRNTPFGNRFHPATESVVYDKATQQLPHPLLLPWYHTMQ